jgi:protein-L-isoaspartate(D-aspartate) O-methyltransferase
VSEAFLAVPRHVFLPGESVSRAYEDTAIVTKSDADGLPVSASTQPAMMAIMLEQLGLAAGQRVLEIGTGTGYNAALIAEIVGDPTSVVSIEVDPDLVDQARASLVAAGFGGVTVVCGDGADGVPGGAPYDRVIVTAGIWDLAPQWLAQVGAGGRIVAPISIRGIQLSVAIERAGPHWVGRSAQRPGAVRRRAGPLANAERPDPPANARQHWAGEAPSRDTHDRTGLRRTGSPLLTADPSAKVSSCRPPPRAETPVSFFPHWIVPAGRDSIRIRRRSPRSTSGRPAVPSSGSSSSTAPLESSIRVASPPSWMMAWN